MTDFDDFMGSESYLEWQAARRRRLIYALCGAVVLLCAGGFFILSSGGGEARRPAPAPRPQKPVGTAAAPPPTPGGGAPAVSAPPVTVIVPPPPGPGSLPPELVEADQFFEKGMERLRAAMRAWETEPGADSTYAIFREALPHLIASQAIYERWVEAHPEQEDSLGTRLTDLAQQLYWCRKTLPATAFPSTDDRPGEPSWRPTSSRPRPAEGSTRPPPAIPPTPQFRPEEAKARFDAVARQALAGGHPDLILEAGLPLLTDARMDGFRDGVADAVERARVMVAFLAAARQEFVKGLGREGDVPLRAGPARGTVTEEGAEFVLRGPAGEKRFRVSDLAGSALAALAAAGGGLAEPAQHFAAGEYLLLRGDLPEGAEQLLIARAGGADLGALGEKLDEVIARSPGLKALGAWLTLSPLLAEPGPALVAAVKEFVGTWAGSPIFAAHRDEIFAAYAKSAGKQKFDIETVFAGDVKLAGKVVTVRYDFESPDQLADFSTWGEFKIENGALNALSRAAWLEKFDLTNADLRFVLSEPCDVVVGFWGAGGRGPKVDFTMKFTDDLSGLEVALRRDDRAFAMEKLPRLTGPTEVVILKREDKYQVRVKNAVVLKGSDASRPGEVLCAVGIACASGPASFEELELKTDLDLEWARGGGKRFASYVEGYWVTGGFPLPKANDVKGGLTEAQWPELEPFEPDVPGADGKPRWAHVNAHNTVLDLNRLLKPGDQCTGYAAVRVWSVEKRTAVIEVECDDDARVFLNGEVVLKEAPIGQPWRAPVKLDKGDNVLLIKVADTVGGFWVRARILGKTGELLPDLLCW